MRLTTMLTDEKRDELELEKAYARQRCKELWGTIQQLNKLTKSYNNRHAFWSKKYQDADRVIAKYDKTTVIAKYKHKKKKQSDSIEIILKMGEGGISELIKRLEREVEE